MAASRPTVNSYKRFQPDSWAPTAIGLGRATTARAGSASSATAQGYRVECRIPGADVQPVPRVRGDDRRRPARHRARARPAARRFDGNAYAGRDLDAHPVDVVEAIDVFERSEVARQGASGPTCTSTCSTPPARSGPAFNRVVTDWERRRNFEQF